MDTKYRLDLDGLIEHLKQGNKFRYRFTYHDTSEWGVISEIVTEKELSYNDYHDVIIVDEGVTGVSLGRYKLEDYDKQTRRLKYYIENDLDNGWDFEFSAYDGIIEVIVNK